MYGMVNQAAKTMVIEKLGENTWISIAEKLQIDPSTNFSPFEQYDDQVTLNAVVAISEVSGISAENILLDFGKYWIGYAQKSEYNEILMIFGTGTRELFKSLDKLHERLQLSMNNLKAPSFEIVEESESTLLINYYSERDLPLEPFVRGLFLGIFEMFNESGNVKQVDTLGDAKATFLIEFH